MASGNSERRSAQGGVGLFYYSGHGIQVDGSNYLVPIDADIQMKAEVEEECINANAVLRVMEFSHTHKHVFIHDKAATIHSGVFPAVTKKASRAWTRRRGGGKILL